MNALCVTICVEGPTDDMLTPIICWTIRGRLGPDVPINDRSVFRSGPLAGRIRAAVRESAACDLLVVHRDADGRDGHPVRVAEIEAAVAEVRSQGIPLPAHLRVIPVREAEAWLLFDEPAIRRAAGRPNGKVALDLPRRDYDSLPDPKRILNDALDRASELSGRKLAKFQRDRRPARVADRIGDFAPLRRLPAFVAFEAEVAAFADGWLAAGASPGG